jgi:hypothetical protein
VRLPVGFANDVSYFVLLVALLLVRNKRANIVLLILLLARYAIIPVLVLEGIGVHGRVF